MYIPRRLEKGPEYRASVEEAKNKGLKKFSANLTTACNVAKFEPEAATQVKGSEIRIAQIYDAVNGYSLALYFVGSPMDETAVLERIEIFELEPEYAPW